LSLWELLGELRSRGVSRYKPRPYGGRTVIIPWDDGNLRSDDPRYEWAKLAGSGCEILKIAAPTHRSLFEQPWVGRLAADLRKALEADENSIVGQAG
jgi:hypothetical protein